MSLASAKLSKIGCTALVAQRISSINSLGAICESTGAGIGDVTRACSMNPRIGGGCLQAGLAFGGSCLKKDTIGLAELAESLALGDVDQYWRDILVVNDFQSSRFAHSIIKSLGGTVRSKRIVFLGLAYKKGTCDARGSITKELIVILHRQGAEIDIFDPLVPDAHIHQQLAEVDDEKNPVRTISDTDEIVQGTDAIIVMNDSQEHESIDWTRIAEKMSDSKMLFDPRGCLIKNNWSKLGSSSKIFKTCR